MNETRRSMEIQLQAVYASAQVNEANLKPILCLQADVALAPSLLCLPPEMADQLGLEKVGEKWVNHSERGRICCSVAGPVIVTFPGGQQTANALLLPGLSAPLLHPGLVETKLPRLPIRLLD